MCWKYFDHHKGCAQREGACTLTPPYLFEELMHLTGTNGLHYSCFPS